MDLVGARIQLLIVDNYLLTWVGDVRLIFSLPTPILQPYPPKTGTYRTAALVENSVPLPPEGVPAATRSKRRHYRPGDHQLAWAPVENGAWRGVDSGQEVNLRNTFSSMTGFDVALSQISRPLGWPSLSLSFGTRNAKRPGRSLSPGLSVACVVGH